MGSSVSRWWNADTAKPAFSGERGEAGERLVTNQASASDNELYIDRDIIVLAHPEIAQLPNWVIALVAAGGLAAALSTAAGLLLVISTAVSHDLMKKTFRPQITEKQELLYARIAAAVAIGIAGLFGIYPPGFVAEVVAFAFGLAAASFFPVIMLGIFFKRMNKEAAIAGMITGLTFTFGYIVYLNSSRRQITTRHTVVVRDLARRGLVPRYHRQLCGVDLFCLPPDASPPPAEIRDLVDTSGYLVNSNEPSALLVGCRVAAVEGGYVR